VKAQKVRVLDVVLVAPAIVAAGVMLQRHRPFSVFLIGLGVLTAAYNARNFVRVRRQLSDNSAPIVLEGAAQSPVRREILNPDLTAERGQRAAGLVLDHQTQIPPGPGARGRLDQARSPGAAEPDSPRVPSARV